MASRIMHLAAAKEILKRLSDSGSGFDRFDENEFLIGQILPDAIERAKKQQVNTHFVKEIDGRKTYDFDRFFQKYKQSVLTDGVFLGYYFHLIEDCVFRRILYYDLGFLKCRGSEEFMQKLYKDYHILNQYFSQKYDLHNSSLNLSDECLKNHKIKEIYDFEIENSFEIIKQNLSEKFSGEPEFFGFEAADRFVDLSAEICVKEFKDIMQNKNGRLSPWDYSWNY